LRVTFSGGTPVPLFKLTHYLWLTSLDNLAALWLDYTVCKQARIDNYLRRK
jgi:hypothetical protein